MKNAAYTYRGSIDSASEGKHEPRESHRVRPRPSCSCGTDLYFVLRQHTVLRQSPLGIQAERLEGPVLLRRPCHGHSRLVALLGPLCIQAGRLQMLVLPRRLCHGRPEHIKRTCDGSIPSNARIRFMLLENSDRNITVLEKSTSNKMSNKIIKKPNWFCTHLFQGVWGQGAGPGPRHKTTQPGSPRMEEEPRLPSQPPLCPCCGRK